MDIHPKRAELVLDFARACFKKSSNGAPAILNPKLDAFCEMVLAADTAGELTKQEVTLIAAGVVSTLGEPLGDERDESRAASLAQELCNVLKSIPRTYHVTIGFPGAQCPTDFVYELGSDVRFVTRIQKPQVPQGLLGLGGITTTIDYQAVPVLAIEVRVTGYMHAFLETAALSRAVGKVKQIVYLLELFGAITRWYAGANTPQVTINCGNEEFQVLGHVTQGMVRSVSQVVLVHSPDPAAAVAGLPSAFLAALAKIKGLFSQDAKETRRLIAAIEWAFDSSSNLDQTLGFIEACIGLESLLGEDDEQMGDMTKRLADRYAYALGRTRPARKMLEEQFKAAFKTRGHLVHAHRGKLTGRDITQLASVQSMLRRLIAQEIQPYVPAQETS